MVILLSLAGRTAKAAMFKTSGDRPEKTPLEFALAELNKKGNRFIDLHQ
jgi:hypothetical protein